MQATLRWVRCPTSSLARVNPPQKSHCSHALQCNVQHKVVVALKLCNTNFQCSLQMHVIYGGNKQKQTPVTGNFFEHMNQNKKHQENTSHLLLLPRLLPLVASPPSCAAAERRRRCVRPRGSTPPARRGRPTPRQGAELRVRSGGSG